MISSSCFDGMIILQVVKTFHAMSNKSFQLARPLFHCLEAACMISITREVNRFIHVVIESCECIYCHLFSQATCRA